MRKQNPTRRYVATLNNLSQVLYSYTHTCFHFRKTMYACVTSVLCIPNIGATYAIVCWPMDSILKHYAFNNLLKFDNSEDNQ